MILLDENIIATQRLILHGWRMRHQQIGIEVAKAGISDGDIVRLLHTLRLVTFFTRDKAFYDRSLCHRKYCLVHLRVEAYEVASFVRRLLSHTEFDTWAKRRGRVVQTSPAGIRCWTPHGEAELAFSWA